MTTNCGGVTSGGTVVVVVVVVEVVVAVGDVVDGVEVVGGASVVDICDVDVVVAASVVDVVVTDDSVPLESHAAIATIRTRLTATQTRRFIVNLDSIVAPRPRDA